MKKLSDKEQQFLLQLIKSCEYYHLNEKRAVECINKILHRNISRRTCYLYRRKLYSHDVFNRLKESIYNSPLDRSAILLLYDDTDPELRAKVNKLVVDQFPDKEKPSFLLPPQYDPENNENMRDKVKDILAKIMQFKETETLRNDALESIPKNATIREEFIQCGKDTCNLCPHGP